MAKLRRNRVVYAKIEGTKGTDATPTGAEAILTKNFQMSEPYAGDRVSRDLDGGGLGLEAEINVNPHVVLSFDVELAGAGSAAVTAGTAPGFGALLRACGFGETITATTDTQYDPVSTFADSVTLYCVIDGDLHKVLGAVGNVSFNFAKGIPMASFTITGNYSTPVTDAAPLTPDFTAFQEPLPMTYANTTFTIGGYAAKLVSMSFDMGIEIFPRNVPNQEEVLQTNRGVTGQIVIDAPAIASKDMFSDFVESHAGINTGALALVHGSTTGNIIQIDAPAVQLSSISEGDESGLLTYSMNARFIPDTGDDEVKITVK